MRLPSIGAAESLFSDYLPLSQCDLLDAVAADVNGFHFGRFLNDVDATEVVHFLFLGHPRAAAGHLRLLSIVSSAQQHHLVVHDTLGKARQQARSPA